METSQFSKKQTAIGLLIVGIFTAYWSYFADQLINGKDYRIIFTISILLSGIFIWHAISLFKIANREMKNIQIDNFELNRKQKLLKLNMIAEFIFIFLAVIILSNLELDKFILPTIALIVGLHFLVFGYLLKRQKDYYIGIWSCLISIVGIITLKLNTYNDDNINIFVCLGAEFSAIIYGIGMTKKAQKIKQLEI